MGGKRNKIRYTAKPVKLIIITLTGKVYLRYRDDEAIETAAVKGDMQVYPRNEALNSTHLGAYDSTGFSGYFKVDVHDGWRWQPVLINDIFPDGENHFRKKECPIDTYNLCLEILQGWAGKNLHRTYREHYEPYDGVVEPEKTGKN